MKFILKIFMKLLLIAHSLLYRLISKLSIELNNGVHPKHSIIGYADWFCKHIDYNWRVFDLGCGKGELSFKMSLKAAKVYAVDNNSEYIGTARQKYREQKCLEFFCANMGNFEYGNIECINCAVLSNSIEHYISPERFFKFPQCEVRDRISLLKKLKHEIKWKDKPLFLIRVPMLERDWLTIYKRNMGVDHRLDKTHTTEFTLDSLEYELNEAGLKPVKTEIRFGEIYVVAET